MTDGLLLDSHTLLWLDARLPPRPEARFEIGKAAAPGKLFLPQISMWEIGVALHKKTVARRPNLRGLSVAAWFEEMSREFGVQSLPIAARDCDGSRRSTQYLRLRRSGRLFSHSYCAYSQPVVRYARF